MAAAQHPRGFGGAKVVRAHPPLAWGGCGMKEPGLMHESGAADDS